MPYRITILTGTRADWGILTPLAQALRNRTDVALSIVATNMHLSERHGMTVNEILRAGFAVDRRVPMPIVTDSPVERIHAMAQCMNGMANALTELRPNAVIILGDRFEMLASASAAAMLRIPIIHIAGGTVSFGAVDDSIRHAITKLASLHLTETEEHRRRVVQMGEDPARVVTCGALGVWNIMHRPLLTEDELAQALGGFRVTRDRTILATYHPATLDNVPPADSFRQLLIALDRFPDHNVLFSGANNDAGGMAINAMIEEYAAANPTRVKAVKTLGMELIISTMRHSAVFVGNSSSGIVEAPSAGIPTVDIGNRQAGRQRAASVIHCPDDADSIEAAIRRALSPEMHELAARRESPYYHENTRTIMVDAIMRFLADLADGHANKTFHDVDFACPPASSN